MILSRSDIRLFARLVFDRSRATDDHESDLNAAARLLRALQEHYGEWIRDQLYADIEALDGQHGAPPHATLH
jgi:hypothetical protein